MKEALIKSLALGTAGMVLCYGCQSGVPSAAGPTTPPTSVSKPVFEHPKEVDDYLVAVRKFMLVAPRNGRFAETRVANFRDGIKHEIGGYQAMDQIGKDNDFMSFVVGISPEMFVSKVTHPAGQPNHGRQPSQLVEMISGPGHIRVGDIHSVINHEPRGLESTMRKDAVAVIEKLQPTLAKEKNENFAQEMTVANKPAWVIAKSVVAPDKSCYSCHSNVKEGVPIGHVVAVIWKSSPKS